MSRQESTERTRAPSRGIIVIGGSLVPVILTYVVFHFKWMRRLAAWPIYLGIMVIGCLAGRATYQFVNPRFRHKSGGDLNPKELDDDWPALIASFIVGFTVMVFIRGLVSHEMAAAFEYEFKFEDN